MKALVARFLREESGQDLIEYGLLVGIITAGAITAINAIGPKVQQLLLEPEQPAARGAVGNPMGGDVPPDFAFSDLKC